MPKLGVNIDHVATLREQRRGSFPDPVKAAMVCEESGCSSIVCHLREDRRHIKEKDVETLRKIVKTRLNLEMSIAGDIVQFACKVKPDQATLVPERRKELTTEGGLDVIKNKSGIKSAIHKLKRSGIRASLFIGPVMGQIDASAEVGAEIIELHTGEYANAKSGASRKRELEKIIRATEYALEQGLEVNAGHGLDYDNVKDVAKIKGMNELNIGYSIIAQAVFTGLDKAVRDMLELVR